MNMKGKSKKASDGKLRALLFVEAFGGGVFTYIVDLANSLSENFDIWIAYGMRDQTPKDYKSYFNKNITLIRVENYTREINAKKDFKAFKEMRKIAHKVKPDIIHLHSSKSGVLGRLAFSGRKYALFYTPHGYSFLMDNCSTVKKIMYKTIEKVCGRAKCMTISCSVGEHKESLKLARSASYINNGINMEYLQQLLAKTDVKKNDEMTVFTLGRICFQKNPELFNKIAQSLPDVKFLWIGDGELRPLLTSKNIQITGWISREKALEYSQSADIFVLTSLWEGLPISLLEAMYMKKLCIVTDVIGNRDVISSGDNGFICKSSEEFVTTLKRIRNKENDCDPMINMAYQEVLEEYNTKVMAKKYSERYQESYEHIHDVI